MRKFLLLVVVVALFMAAACRAREPEPTMRPTATIKDIMDAVVDPSADGLWESVATIISASGIEERQPRTDEDWKAVRAHAIRLIEASNLLLVDGRQVAPHGHKSEFPGIELEPEQIEVLIAQDRATWIKLAHGLHDAAMPALKAIDARSAQGLLDAGEAIDVACENCHLKYWYPNTPQAADATATAK
jgi:hypothetical protein